jgi:hypothetical protein
LLAESLANQALRYALLLPACFLVFPALALYGVSKTLPRDLEASGVTVR